LDAATLNDPAWRKMTKKQAGTLTHLRQAGRIPVVLHPGSGSEKKNWPVGNFARLIRTLKSNPRVTPLILEGPHDALAADSLKTELGHPPQIEILRVDDLLALASCLHECALYVGNDSGVAHLSAFLGTPTIAVFGPSDPIQWAPLGRRVRVLFNPQGCKPCHSDNQRNCQHDDCARFPSEQEVASAALDLLLDT
jgi:ADP-heptose:LPS heptosyltransferase